jgi:hypothetical protein
MALKKGRLNTQAVEKQDEQLDNSWWAKEHSKGLKHNSLFYVI